MISDESATLNYLIKEFEAISEAHEMLNFYEFGNFLKIVQSDSVEYNCLLFNCSNVGINENYFVFQCDLMVAGKVFKDESNHEDIQSDTLNILGDIYSIVTKADRWTDFCTVTANGNARKFIKKGEDEITGWGLTLSINVLRKNGFCDIPMSGYDYEGAFEAYCKGVDIYKDGVFELTVPSGERFDYSTASDPAGNILNGVTLTEIVGGTTKTFLIQYDDLSPVTITTVLDNATLFRGTIPAPVGAPTVVFYRPLLLQSFNVYDYDEKWHIDNGTFNQTLPANYRNQEIADDTTEKIKFDDDHLTGITEHKFRFVGASGGYYNPSDGNYYDKNGVLSDRQSVFQLVDDFYIIDRLHGTAWRGVRGGTGGLPGFLAITPFSFSLFNDFFIPPHAYMKTLQRTDLQFPLYLTDRPPFDIQLQPWSCTYSYINTVAFYMATTGALIPAVDSTLRQLAYMRVHEFGVDDQIALYDKLQLNFTGTEFTVFNNVTEKNGTSNRNTWSTLNNYTDNVKGSIFTPNSGNLFVMATPSAISQNNNAFSDAVICGCDGTNLVRVYEFGILVFDTGITANDNDEFQIVWSGSNYQYYHNGALIYTGAVVSGGAGGTHWVGSMISTNGGIVRMLDCD